MGTSPRAHLDRETLGIRLGSRCPERRLEMVPPSRQRTNLERGRVKTESERVLTVSELAAYLRISRARIYYLVKHHAGNAFPAFRVGRAWRINLYQFQDWMCQQLEAEQETALKRAKLRER